MVGKLEKIALPIVLAMLALLALASHYRLSLFELFESRTYDIRFRTLRPTAEKNERIGIIAIDEKSIEELGRFPWTRTVYAPLLDNLGKAGAKAVLMDAFFSEAENNKADSSLEAALKRSGIVTMATAFEFGPGGGIVKRTASLERFTQYTGTAHINFFPDDDGVNRWTMPLITYEEEFFPSLGLQGALIAMEPENVDMVNSTLIIDNTSIPLTDGLMYISYAGPPGSYDYFSFVDVAKGRVPAEKLKDKILFLGATALGIYDMRVSPYHNNTPGVEIHAAIADSIMRGSFMRRGRAEEVIDIAAIFALGLLSYFVMLHLAPKRSLPIVAFSAILYVALVCVMFKEGRWISIVYPLAAMAACSAGSSYARFMVYDRRAREMRSMFSSYVSPKVVDALISHPEFARLGGDTREITILFSDVKGYTSYSEKRPPEEVVQTLNEYLGAMASVIIDNDGTLDKFLGDGIMAYWGAPLPDEHHAARAVQCVLAMHDELLKLHEIWKARGVEPLSFRVGVNAGAAVAGNIGAHGKKMEYTVIGDTVNLASRLESTCKVYGVTSLVSESVVKLAGSEYVFRELDMLRVVGKSLPIRVFELIGRAADVSEDKKKRVADFERGLVLYRARKWPEAALVFAKLASEDKTDAAAELYKERCRAFLLAPPPEGWDGVFVRAEK